MIAHLGMYDMAHTRKANDAFWMLIRRDLGFGPVALTREGDFWDIWQSPDLLLAQTCGYPFRAVLHDKVTLVGTPDYGLPGCPPGHYNSIFVKRRDDPRTTLTEFDGARFAYNEPLSQSGWAAPIHHMIGAGLRPGALVQTGAHANSFLAVHQGEADFAALDALTLKMIQTGDWDELHQISGFESTAPTPALPYITAKGRDAEPIRTALQTAIDILPDAPRRDLSLKALVCIPAEVYLAVPTPPPPETLDLH